MDSDNKQASYNRALNSLGFSFDSQRHQQPHLRSNQQMSFEGASNEKQHLLGPNINPSRIQQSKQNIDNAENFNNESNNDSNKFDDPTNNRTTDAQTMMHILKANIGTGVLAMPNAFKNVGLWLGFILVPIIGSICIHCMNILISSHNHLCDRFNYESLDYDQVAALGLACGPNFTRRLAKRAHLVVTTFLILTQVGFCCVYIMFVVENLQVAILNLFKIEYSTTTYLLLVFPLIGLTSCTSNLKHLARISTFANILQLTGLALIFFDLLQFHTYSQQVSIYNLQQFDQQESATSAIGTNNVAANYSSTQTIDNDTLEQSSNLKVKVNNLISDDIFNGLPLFFATAVYAFEGIGVVLPLIKEMQHPSRISGSNGVLNTSMSLVALLYMAMGFFGYSKYGQFVQGSITLNLPQTTLNELVRLIFATAIGLSYSLQFYVPWTIIWPQIDECLFYSYRPRECRDKLQILNCLSSENDWAIDEASIQQVQHQQQQQNQQYYSIKKNVTPNNNPSAGVSDLLLNLDDNNSTASTFATSYAMSTVCPLTSRKFQHQVASNLTCHNLREGAPFNIPYDSISQQAVDEKYIGGSHQPQQPTVRRLRNRLGDVMVEHELAGDSMDDCIPEVQWRPPPRSMRGKRKLVRYTVILVSVSFTFVAAALIPRLDLFISLIGALASSCLAIIFPAIIQMCTFWSTTHSSGQQTADNEDDQDDAHDELDDHVNAASGSLKGLRSARKRRQRRRMLFWYLFIIKNSLLIVFGILGLITGSWISISQLSAIYTNGGATTNGLTI